MLSASMPNRGLPKFQVDGGGGFSYCCQPREYCVKEDPNQSILDAEWESD